MGGTTLLVPVLDEVDGVAVVAALADACGSSGVVDHVLVVDGGSTDGTADAYAAAGIDVLDARSTGPGGVPRGKGEAVWRAATVLGGDRVVLVDGDVEGLDAAAVGRLAGALDDPSVHLAKGAFARRQRDDGTVRELGGRVTELLARPLLARFAADLDHVTQPLSGQQAVRLATLRRLPLLSGYGLEMGLLLAVRDRYGPAAVVSVPLPAITHDSRPDASLVPMAHEVLAAATWGLGLRADGPDHDGDHDHAPRGDGPVGGPGAGLVVLPPTGPRRDGTRGRA